MITLVTIAFNIKMIQIFPTHVMHVLRTYDYHNKQRLCH